MKISHGKFWLKLDEASNEKQTIYKIKNYYITVKIFMAKAFVWKRWCKVKQWKSKNWNWFLSLN